MTDFLASHESLVTSHFPDWSGQRDSNPRPSAPKADALPDCAMPRRFQLSAAPSEGPPRTGRRIIRMRSGMVNLVRKEGDSGWVGEADVVPCPLNYGATTSCRLACPRE
jgi:hypothetical protein